MSAAAAAMALVTSSSSVVESRNDDVGDGVAAVMWPHSDDVTLAAAAVASSVASCSGTSNLRWTVIFSGEKSSESRSICQKQSCCKDASVVSKRDSFQSFLSSVCAFHDAVVEIM